MVYKFLFACHIFVVIAFTSSAQKITYSDPEKNNARLIDFSIVGKINNHYLVYQHTSSYNISVYDASMKLVDKVSMDFLPDSIINSDIITYKNYFYFIYQYQKNNIISCAAVKINGDGKIHSDPVILDTTIVNFSAKNKIYTVLYSEDKQKIAVYKIDNNDIAKHIFIAGLFDEQLTLIDKFSAVIPRKSYNDFLTGFILDNTGTIVFVKVSGNSANGIAQNISLLVKYPGNDKIDTYPLNIEKNYLKDIYLKANNLSNHFFVTGFYYKQGTENVDGLYCAVWNKTNRQMIVSKEMPFNDQQKNNAKSKGNSRAALNNYYVQNIIVRKDGGFVIVAEASNTSDNAIISNNWSMINIKEYVTNNIVAMSFDSAANMQWFSIIPKSQYGKNTYNFISYGTYLKSGEVNFLFNQVTKKSTLMQSVQLNVSGKVALNPLLKNLDRAYDFMPRFSKQVSINEVIIPCQFKNNLCFTRIDF